MTQVYYMYDEVVTIAYEKYFYGTTGKNYRIMLLVEDILVSLSKV